MLPEGYSTSTPSSPFSLAVNAFVAISLLAAGVAALIALDRGGIPAEIGAPPDREAPAETCFRAALCGAGGLSGRRVDDCDLRHAGIRVRPFYLDASPGIPPAGISGAKHGKDASPLVRALAVPAREVSRPAGLVLALCVLVAFGYLIIETFRLPRIPRHRMFVVLILTFFSMVFWAFYEQAGSSVNNFTDRNVNRVLGAHRVTADEVGNTIHLQPTQEQLGYFNGDQCFTLDLLDKLRDEHKDAPNFEIDWKVTKENVGMGLAKRVQEIPASTFQSVNPIYILFFGLIFTALWTLLANRGLEPSTPVKFSLGLLQLGLGFGVFWYGAQTADPRGMVALSWLFLGYLLHTTGELRLSPVGLSMITKLSPPRLISTVMGAWFLATAVSQLAAGIIAQFTGVTEGESSAIPIPKETVHVYGDVFGKVAIAALISAVLCFAISPLLTRWMHEEACREREMILLRPWRKWPKPLVDRDHANIDRII